MLGFTMLMVDFFGSDAFFEQLRCAAGWNTFQNQKCHQQPTQPQLVYSALGGQKCGRIPRTQPQIGGEITPQSRDSRVECSATKTASTSVLFPSPPAGPAGGLGNITEVLTVLVAEQVAVVSKVSKIRPNLIFFRPPRHRNPYIYSTASRTAHGAFNIRPA